MLLFVGRIQPLKGVDVAVRTLAALRRPDASLVVVGGASGLDGDAEVEKVAALVDELGLTERVHFVPPQPHHLLSSYYRAADVVLVPSRSESFGLVALEGAACGTPVVASAVGGLLTLVDHGHSGFLVHGRDPEVFASYTDEILGNPRLAREMAQAAAARSQRYTWSLAAARLRRAYGDLTAGALVECIVSELFDSGALAVLERQVDEWLHAMAAANPVVSAVGRDEDTARRWYVRMRGEAKEVTTVWLSLGQRTLRYETYVMPAPEENQVELYEQLLRRNERLVGAHFSIGVEDAVFLRGELPLAVLSEEELDRVIGSLYAYVEQCFPSAIRLGFASRF